MDYVEREKIFTLSGQLQRPSACCRCCHELTGPVCAEDSVWTARRVETVNISDDVRSERRQLRRHISSCGVLFTGPAVTLRNQSTDTDSENT